MITNFDTNKVLFARGLADPTFQGAGINLVNAMDRNKVSFAALPDTDSPYYIWCRDYMPIQVSKDKFVMFRYEPDYLSDSPEYIPDTSEMLDKLGIDGIGSDIVLDGGNVISCGDKVIMTDKIFKENLHYTRKALIEKLEYLLEAELVLIPWDRYEEYGHSDGMVRYIGEGRVLLNNYCDFDNSLRKKLLSALSPQFDVEELHYGSHTKNSWSYINFLHVGHHIFIPHLRDSLVETAFLQISSAFPNCTCLPIQRYDSIVAEGGALNCSTWNIFIKQ